MDKSDEFWMRMAIDQAKEGKTPYGAVIVDQNYNFVSAFNTTKLDGPTAHAEINVLQKVSELDHDTTEDLTLFTTVEPCPMCMSAMIWSKIGRLVFGASIEVASKHGYQIPLNSSELAAIANRPIEIKGGILSQKCEEILQFYS